MCRKLIIVIGILFVLGSVSKRDLLAQEQQSKQTTQQDTTKKKPLKIYMDQIKVRGWVEKPQTVFVVPGIDPEVDDIVLDRSFLNEIMRPLDKREFEQQKVLKRKTVIPW